MNPTIIFCFPLPTDNVGINYIALSLYKAMRKQGLPVQFITPVIRREAFGIEIEQCVPAPLRLMPWKYMRSIAAIFYRKALLSAAEKNPGAVFHLWSDHSPELMREIKVKGGIIAKEKFNCAQAVAHDILSTEFRRLALPFNYPITRESIASEQRQLEEADYIFSPSPMVAQSLRDVGVSASKIIAASFGHAGVKQDQGFKLDYCDGPRFLFVGSVDIRKGAHLLLDYWHEAAIEGTLVLLGKVSPEIAALLVERPELNKNVLFLGHQEKAHGIYSECEVFCFPSLEEGGPLVTYEAAARGLPCLVSPMGAGAVVRDGVEGFVIDPHEKTAWVSAIRRMAGSNNEEMTVSAVMRAERFTWPLVAAHRYSAISQKLALTGSLAIAGNHI